MDKKYPKMAFVQQPNFTKVVEVLKDGNDEVMVYGFEYHNDKEGYSLVFTENLEYAFSGAFFKAVSDKPFTDEDFKNNLLNYLKFYLVQKDQEGLCGNSY